MPSMPDPYRIAVHTLLPRDLKDELDRAERKCETDLAEAKAARARAEEWIRTTPFDRPYEHLEAELEREYEERVAYHLAKFAKSIRGVLEAWKDMGEDEA